MMMKLNLDSSDRTPPDEFESCLLTENFNPEFDELDNEPSFIMNDNSTENVSKPKKSDLAVESNKKSITAANDDVQGSDPILDIEEDVDFAKQCDHSVNMNLTLIVETSTTSAVKELLNDVITIVENASWRSHFILHPCEYKMKKCNEKIDESRRNVIDDKYWGLEEYGRRLWVQNHVTFDI